MPAPAAEVVLAVDPGRQKCGLALLQGDTVVRRAVVAPADLARVLREWAAAGTIERVVLGGRTGVASIQAILRAELPHVALELVDESGTTLEARRLYFADHPPRGWRRLLPRSLQLPPEPYDDYAAVALAKRRAGAEVAPGTAD